MPKRCESREKKSVHKSRAWAALRLALADKSQHLAAEESGVVQSTINKLIKLRMLASRTDALALFRTYGIEVGWWDEAPTPQQLRALKSLEEAA